MAQEDNEPLIDRIHRSDVVRLAEVKEPPCVSIFMETDPVGVHRERDVIKLKNLLSAAEEELVEAGARRPEAREILSDHWDALENDDFWRWLGPGLALYASPLGAERFRLSRPERDLAFVGGRFVVKPLIASLSRGYSFYVLAISQNHVGLLQGSRHELSPVDLGDAPHDIKEALWYLDREAHLNFHQTGGGAVMFHGQGPGDREKADLEEFFRRIDKAINDVIADHEAPLVLAAVDYLHPIYHRVSRYPSLTSQGLMGNPEHIRPGELHDKVWSLVEPALRADRARAVTMVEERLHTEEATDILDSILYLAHQGRVGVLFVPADEFRWGTFDADTGRVEQREQKQPGDVELLDLAAATVLRYGGEVYAVEDGEVPGTGPAAALLRG